MAKKFEITGDVEDWLVRCAGCGEEQLLMFDYEIVEWMVDHVCA